MRPLLLALVFLLPAYPAVAEAELFSVGLRDVDGQPVTLARHQGKPLIVNFWARWCAPCREEIPELVRLRETRRGQLEVVGIGIESDPAAVRAFAHQYGITYPLLLGAEHGIPLMRQLGNSRGGLPYTVAVDRHGRIVYSKLGLMRKADLEAAATLAVK